MTYQCIVHVTNGQEVKEVFNKDLTENQVFTGPLLGLDFFNLNIATFNYVEKTLKIEYKPKVDLIKETKDEFPQWNGLKEDGELVVIRPYRHGKDVIDVRGFEQINCKTSDHGIVSFQIGEKIEIQESQINPSDPHIRMVPMSPISDDDELQMKDQPNPISNMWRVEAKQIAAKKLAAEEEAKKLAKEAAQKLAKEAAEKLAKEEAKKKEEAEKLAKEEAKKKKEAKKVLIEQETKIVEQAQKEMVDSMDKVMGCVNYIDDLSEKVFNDWSDKKITYAHAWVSHMEQMGQYEEHKKGIMMDQAIVNAFHNNSQPLYNMYAKLAHIHNQREDVLEKIAKNTKPKKGADGDASVETPVVAQKALQAAIGRAPRKALAVKRKGSGKARVEPKVVKKTKKSESDNTDLVISERKDAPADLITLMNLAVSDDNESESDDDDN